MDQDAWTGGACERGEWRALAVPLAMLLGAYGAGLVYSLEGESHEEAWPIVVPYVVGLA